MLQGKTSNKPVSNVCGISNTMQHWGVKLREICKRQSTMKQHRGQGQLTPSGCQGGRRTWGHSVEGDCGRQDVRGQNQPFCSDTVASPPAIADSACIQRPKVKVMLKRRQWRDDESWEKDGMILFMPRSLTQHSWQNAHTHTSKPSYISSFTK